MAIKGRGGVKYSSVVVVVVGRGAELSFCCFSTFGASFTAPSQFNGILYLCEDMNR